MRRATAVAVLGLAVAAHCRLRPPIAATFKPTRSDDPPPGKCKPDDCSLREAVIKANNHAGTDKVSLRKGKYKLTIPEAFGDPNDSSGGDLDVYGEGAIVGKGAKTIVSGEGLHRVFHFQGSFSTHTLSKLTVRGGDAGAEDGGGIEASNLGGEVKLSRVVVRDSSANRGGGVFSYAGNLVVDRTTIAGNDASQSGGGIFQPAVSGLNPATSTIRRSTISGNHALGGLGGGIALDGFDAGGFPSEPVMNMVNSTVAANTAAVSGGGISAIFGSSVDLDNSTIGANKADSDNAGGGAGGGVFQSSGAAFGIGDSILADNSHGTSGADNQCSGTFTGTANVLNAIVGCSSFPSGPNREPATQIALPLAKNGGPTQTMALFVGSSALDFAATCPPRDQRGVKRDPDECDSGSFELSP